MIKKELSIIELSNELMNMGCEDICRFGNWNELLNDGNVVVATDECGENHIQIFFTTVATAGEDEVIESSIIRIDNIEKF